MKFGIRELNGVLNEIISNSIDFFKTKYRHQKAIDIIQNFSDFPERVMRNTKALFVLSTGRTGTDFVTHLLQQSNRLRVEHEAVPGLGTASRYLYDNDLMPEAKFIHMVRHPGAFVRSGMRRGYYTSDYIADYGKIRPTEQDEAFEKWDSYSRIEKISWLWYRTNKIIEDFKESCSERVMMVKSEDLFKQPDAVVINMLNFVKETVPDHITTDLGPKNKQRSGSFHRYKKWKDKDKERLRSITGQLAEKYEYTV